MSDDIVTRLRGQRTNGVLCDEAADEIERLRAVIDSATDIYVVMTTKLVSEIDELALDRDKWAELAKMCAACYRKLHGLEKAWDND